MHALGLVLDRVCKEGARVLVREGWQVVRDVLWRLLQQHNQTLLFKGLEPARLHLGNMFACQQGRRAYLLPVSKGGEGQRSLADWVLCHGPSKRDFLLHHKECLEFKKFRAHCMLHQARDGVKQAPQH